MKKKNRTVWSNRLSAGNSKSFQRIGSSIHVDKRLYKEDIFASIVHTKMLIRQSIIPKKDGLKIIKGLKKIEKEIVKNKFKFKEQFEDIHQNIEKRLFQIIGESAGYLHTARSRNDQVVTDFKMWVKDSSKDIMKSLNGLVNEILKKAEKNINTVMPGFTHLKNAQPVSFAHYLLAYVEMLNRDKKRFANNINLIDECPLGSAALAGTSFNIDRKFTAKKLGFKKPTNNSIDSVSDRDFAIDFLSAAATCAMHLSRLAEDFIIFNSEAFGFVEFSDKVLTGSSIMPQKKNPDPAELIRGRTAINYGNLNSMLTIMKGLPISYYKDLQDDKELVFDSYDTLKDSLLMSTELIENLNTKKNNMKNMALKGYTTATDFADFLTKEKKLPFREGYSISAKLVNYAERKKIRLDQLSKSEINKFVKKVEINVPKIFGVVNSMNSKTSFGGTATKNIKKMIIKYRSELK
ncbi:MAG: argininosuccinate lyase [Candidatus Marinimicrobia bacterium]|nr:argininosuccinate lyase [Candidatus Neomarinimicrobiota bacterium]RPG04835.1 MAG: argininosuccinate lyase [Pelagibacteraceae bacterium TMED247]|tara:strand:+ start:44 stop:1432 length:1389 start_codon:yes stop_codon:yes gene_type:complete